MLNVENTVISDISVERTGEDTVRIYWDSRGNSPDVSIYRGDTPGSIDRSVPLARVSNDYCAEISSLDPLAPHYFELVAGNHSGILTAERKIPFKGAFNFRDLGGYETEDGRRVKWGRVYRSDNLSGLTDNDLTLLRKTGIKLVCDFRSRDEAQTSPDQLPADGSIRYLNLPVKNDHSDTASRLEQIKAGDLDWITLDFMIDAYLKYIDRFAPVWGTVLNRLAEAENRPMVFHCTAGKDRAGTCAALLLLALGIPEETVIYDHGLSNTYIAALLEKIYRHFKTYRIDTERLEPYFTAPHACIVAVINHIHKKYGTVDNYLESRGGVGSETIVLLKEALLE